MTLYYVMSKDHTNTSHNFNAFFFFVEPPSTCESGGRKMKSDPFSFFMSAFTPVCDHPERCLRDTAAPLFPSSLSPVVNIRCLIHPVQCQQFKRAQFVFLSTSISVILLRVLRSHFSTRVLSKALKCVGISECDCRDDTIFWQGGASQRTHAVFSLCF